VLSRLLYVDLNECRLAGRRNDMVWVVPKLTLGAEAARLAEGYSYLPSLWLRKSTCALHFQDGRCFGLTFPRTQWPDSDAKLPFTTVYIHIYTVFEHYLQGN
jgi:hypothetical protein